MTRETVNVFFASDERYLPYLSVALASLSENASDEYDYNIRILTTSFGTDALYTVKNLVKPNVTISVENIQDKVTSIRNELSLRLRDYYSESIYYRLFIPSLYPELHRAVYLDADIVLNDDVAKLYFYNIEDNLVGAVTDESVTSLSTFVEYVTRYIGLDSAEKYFNSGVLVMNLDAIREAGIEERFVKILSEYNFDTVAPDQDYLNLLCQNRVCYLPEGWNKHPILENEIPEEELHLMHFNMFNKPWHYSDVQYGKLFWRAATKTPFLPELLSEMKYYSEESMLTDIEGMNRLIGTAKRMTEEATPVKQLIPKELYTTKGTDEGKKG